MPSDEKPQTFEQYVDEWDKLVGQINEIKKQLKPLTDKEMPMRRAIFGAVQTAMGDLWKEGTNTYTLSDGRKLKVVNSIKREVDPAMRETALAAFSLQNDTNGVTFDELLRVSYGLEKKEWDKLPDEAKKAISIMITAKPDTPAVTIA